MYRSKSSRIEKVVWYGFRSDYFIWRNDGKIRDRNEVLISNIQKMIFNKVIN